MQKKKTYLTMPTHAHLNYAQRQAYRRDVLNIPSPLDAWLLSNARSPRIAFLKVYLMLDDVEAEYVTCLVEMEHDIVSHQRHSLII